MSQENVEVVVGLFEHTSARDFGAVMDAYADDVVLDIHGDLATAAGDGAVGKEAVGRWFGDWFRTFDSDYRFQIEETRDLGDRVFIVATHQARGRRSGVQVSQRIAWIYTVSDGEAQATGEALPGRALSGLRGAGRPQSRCLSPQAPPATRNDP